jgi:hypothetical protein
MNIKDVAEHLRNTESRVNFDAWISTNIGSLTNLFYTLSKDDLRALNFDTNFYFGVFTQSTVFREFENTRTHSEPFDAFLYLLASVAEKLTEYFGLTATMDHLWSYLPESSVKYRLKALSQSQDIDDIRTDYIQFLPRVLNLLQKAENLEDDNHTQRLVDFLIYYYQTAEQKLSDGNYLAELEQLKAGFTSEANINQFHFLGHIAIQELIAGRYPHQLEIENIELFILYPSAIVENHFKYNINQPVLGHKDSQGISVLMGYDKLTILNDVLNRGKTRFDEKYECIEPDEKVLLYCYFNMKKHFFTSVAVFKKMWKSLNQILTDKSYSPVFIDLGCGPLTSGLALAELYQNETMTALRLNYIGIDISKAMIKKANEFTESDLFHKDSTFRFYANWNEIDLVTLKTLAGKNNPFFLNASYLFANLSAEIVDDLVIFVKMLADEYKNVHFIFQNPDRVDRNINWERFKGQLSFKEIDKRVEQVIYKTSRSTFREPSTEDVYYEILTIRA